MVKVAGKCVISLLVNCSWDSSRSLVQTNNVKNNCENNKNEVVLCGTGDAADSDFMSLQNYVIKGFGLAERHLPMLTAKLVLDTDLWRCKY